MFLLLLHGLGSEHMPELSASALCHVVGMTVVLLSDAFGPQAFGCSVIWPEST